MVDWEWTVEALAPDDVLDAARTIPAASVRLSVALDKPWLPASRYLGWATAALQRGGDDGWDTASSLAKRAVCRQMDGILINSHLHRFLGDNYEKKARLLAALQVPGLRLLREVVIDPRNGIEHEYQAATERQARHACEAAELFLRSTAEAAERPAVVSLGWPVHLQFQQFDALEKGRRSEVPKLTKEHGPTLLILGYPNNPAVTVVAPREETARTCALAKLSSDQVLALNGVLRGGQEAPAASQWAVPAEVVAMLRSAMKL